MLFYRPDDGVAADFIPFYWQGDYHLFYLKDYRDPAGHGEGTPWFHLVSRDFVSFEELGEALERGAPGTQDQWVFTGSVIEREGRFFIFYTGHNGHFAELGKPIQAVMRATSPDMISWTKDAGFMFYAPTAAGYEPDDWRDPYVFWNPEARAYWMLLAARKTQGPSRNRGLTALATSPDLEDWQVSDPFWAPDIYYTHECPDLFRMGEWWYLVYSTFSERSVTHYRMSRSLAGPWLAHANDTFDGRAYYAAKTAGDGQRRYVFGWLPTRSGEKDDGDWNWGGNLVVHEIVQSADGTLAVRPPDSLVGGFTDVLELHPRPLLGNWSWDGACFHSSAIGRHAALLAGELPSTCMIEATLKPAPGTHQAGLILRADPELSSYYTVRLEPGNHRLVVDRWPRPGDQPFMLERPLLWKPGADIRLRVLVDETCMVIYANDQIALSCRLYEHRSGSLGLFVTEGEAAFENVHIRTQAPGAG